MVVVCRVLALIMASVGGRRVHMCMCECVCVCVHVHVYCMCMCKYVYAYIVLYVSFFLVKFMTKSMVFEPGKRRIS
jgi:hypothetical protein